MSALPAVLKETRTSRHEPQAAVARGTGVDRTVISKLEHGRIPADAHMVRQLADYYDCPRLYKEIAVSLGRGVFVHGWLDGERVDLHRSSVKAKCQEELGEALAALGGIDLVNLPGEITDERRDEVRQRVIDPLLGAECAIEMMLAVLFQAYGFSPRREYERFARRQEQKGYRTPASRRRSA